MIKLNLNTAPYITTITGHECIFDSHADSRGLYVTVSSDGHHKKLRYGGGCNESKYYCRIYMNAPDHLQVDHINGNPLDNRKVNLRLVTRVQNMANQVASSTKTSGLPKGVYKGKGGKFGARLMYEGQSYSLGAHLTPEEAGAAYEEKAAQLQGEYAVHLSRNS